MIIENFSNAAFNRKYNTPALGSALQKLLADNVEGARLFQPPVSDDHEEMSYFVGQPNANLAIIYKKRTEFTPGDVTRDATFQQKVDIVVIPSWSNDGIFTASLYPGPIQDGISTAQLQIESVLPSYSSTPSSRIAAAHTIGSVIDVGVSPITPKEF